jgi:hypothetical protein
MNSKTREIDVCQRARLPVDDEEVRNVGGARLFRAKEGVGVGSSAARFVWASLRRRSARRRWGSSFEAPPRVVRPLSCGAGGAVRLAETAPAERLCFC